MPTKSLEFKGWESITDVPCIYRCDGTIRWAENGYVPGYRKCDSCGRHFELSYERDRLVPNGQRDRVTAKDREDRARAEQAQELDMAIYRAIVAIREGCSLYLGTVTWDRHAYYRPQDIDALAARVGGPNMPSGLAELMDQMRRTAYPAAWLAYQSLRPVVEAGTNIHISPDGETAELVKDHTLGTFSVAEILRRRS